MKTLLLVGLGGCLGAMIRYKFGGFLLHQSISWKFPVSTLFVNIIGCFLTGLLIGLSSKFTFIDAEWRAFVYTGILGGFTTFSAFGMETVYLLQRNELLLASINVGASLILSMLALMIAIRIFS